MSVFNKLFGRAGKPLENEVRLDLATPPVPQAAMPEPASPGIRLVVWDPDDVLWQGRLAEGETTFRPDAAEMIEALEARGIASSICARGDTGAARAILLQEKVWSRLVHPSIDWSPPGPRLAALGRRLGMAPAAVAFISASPARLAEAAHALPGIHCFTETIIDRLPEHPDLADLSEIASETISALRARGELVPPPARAPAGNTDFLRASSIQVSIEYDFASHIDRAIALLATDTPMNFTKAGQRRNPVRAAAHFRDTLTRHFVQAGILRVRDAYEDYGYCGLYVMRVNADSRKLLHFCFSPRIAGMGVETWLYDRLGKPAIETAGEMLTDLQNDPVPDWLALTLPDGTPADGLFDTIFARGGSDVQSVMPYLAMLGKTVLCDYATARGQAGSSPEHSVFARGALQGVSQAALDAIAPLGFTQADFASGLTALPPPGRDFWLLSFSKDAQTTLWRHRSTGVMVPAKLPQPVKLGEKESDDDADCRRAMKLNFEPAGLIDEPAFKTNLRAILGAAPAGTRVFILLMNDMNPFPDEEGRLVIEPNRRVNDWIAAEAAGAANVELISPTDFASAKGEIGTDNLFDRMVYVRIAQHILNRARSAYPAPQ